MDLTPSLEPVRASAKLEAVLVTDQVGHLIGAAAMEQVTPETLDALLALARRVVSSADQFKALIAAKETLFFDWEGRQVVCRPFEAAKQPYLLVIFAPRQKAYKQAASKLIKAAQKTLKSA